MTTFVLNEQTNHTTVRELLASAVDQEIRISDESGQLVARLLLEETRPQDDQSRAFAWAEANIDEIRRRMQSSREHEVTTQELMARCRSLAPE